MQHNGLQQIKRNVQPYNKKQVGSAMGNLLTEEYNIFTYLEYIFTNLQVESKENILKKITLTIPNKVNYYEIKNRNITKVEFFQKNTDEKINIGISWFGLNNFNDLNITDDATINFSDTNMEISLKKKYKIHEDLKDGIEGIIRITYTVNSEEQEPEQKQEVGKSVKKQLLNITTMNSFIKDTYENLKSSSLNKLDKGHKGSVMIIINHIQCLMR